MLPADERLERHQLTRLKRENRLIDEPEFAAPERLAQLGLGALVCGGLLVNRLVEIQVGLTQLLGAVHGDVGIFEDRFGVFVAL